MLHWFTDPLVHWFIQSVVHGFVHVISLASRPPFELPPKLYVFLRYEMSPSFYKGLDQTFTKIHAVSRNHPLELVAAAMAKVVKKQCQDVPGCARISTVTRRSTSQLQHFIAFASQKLSCRPLISCSQFYFSKLPPRHGRALSGTVSIYMHVWACVWEYERMCIMIYSKGLEWPP